MLLDAPGPRRATPAMPRLPGSWRADVFEWWLMPASLLHRLATVLAFGWGMAAAKVLRLDAQYGGGLMIVGQLSEWRKANCPCDDCIDWRKKHPAKAERFKCDVPRA